MFLCKQFLRLKNRMPRAQLLVLFHILHAVSNGRAYRLTAKARHNDIAPRPCRICRVNDVLQHRLARCAVQYLRQLRFHARALPRCQYDRNKVQHDAPPVLRKRLFDNFLILFALALYDGCACLSLLLLDGVKQRLL